MAPPTWKRYRPDPTPEGEPDASAATRPRIEAYQPPQQARPVRSLDERTVRRRGWKLPLAGVVVLGLAAWGVTAIVRNATAPDDPQTVEGYSAMLDDLEEETGGTDVLSAVIYPDYAVVEVPLGPADTRYDSYRWGGDLDEWSKGNSPDKQAFDLRDVDPAHFSSMCADARELVPDPLACYLIVEKPEGGETGWVSAYISNDYRQGGYIEYDLTGAEVARYTW